MTVLTPKEKKQRYTERWRERGWRQVSFWVPDAEVIRIQEFIKEIKNEYLRRDAESGENIDGNDG